MKIVCHTVQDQQRASEAIYNHERPVQVEIKKYKSTRSLAQNKMLWLWYDLIRMHIADSGGELFTAEDMHEFYKAKFLPSKVVEVNGEAIRCRSTTTKLNTKEMTDYLESIERHAAVTLHLILPLDDILRG